MANRVHHFQIRALAIATDIINLTHAAIGKHCPNGAAVVGHVKPVANLTAVAVNWQGLALEAVQDHQRYQFFRKLIRTIVVGAVGRERWQAIGVVVGPHEVIAGRFGRRVG